jgi:hypothetical protein
MATYRPIEIARMASVDVAAELGIESSDGAARRAARLRRLAAARPRGRCDRGGVPCGGQPVLIAPSSLLRIAPGARRRLELCSDVVRVVAIGGSVGRPSERSAMESRHDRSRARRRRRRPRRGTQHRRPRGEGLWFLATVVRMKLVGAQTAGRLAMWEGVFPLGPLALAPATAGRAARTARTSRGDRARARHRPTRTASPRQSTSESLSARCRPSDRLS